MAAVIDTLEIARELRDVGLTEPQADAIARQFKKRYEADRDELVTRGYLDTALARQTAELRAEFKADVAELRTELKDDIAGLRTELKDDIASLRTEMARLERDLILKLGGIITLAVAVVGALGVLF